MSKVVTINAYFSCTPGTDFDLVSPKRCKCLKGTLYVMASGAAGYAEGAKSKVVALCDGAKAVQVHASGTISGMTDKAELEFQATAPSKPATTKAVDTGSSKTAGAESTGIQQLLHERGSPFTRK
jgi:hypothetical protein